MRGASGTPPSGGSGVQAVARSGRSEAAVHDVQADVAMARVSECLGNRADDLETESLPQRNRASIGLDDGVELHGAKPAGAGPGERVFSKRAPDALPRSAR